VTRRLRLLIILVLPAVMTGLAATSGAGVAPAHAFAMAECLATGAGLTRAANGMSAWMRDDPAARALACREAARAHRDRARWEAEYQVARKRARAVEIGARFRAERTRVGLGPPLPAPPPVPDASRLSPCTRPDATDQCAATPEQILYQIQKSRAAPGAATGEAPVAR
jgi:hypothetical protein